MSSLFGRRASPPQKGDRAAFPPDKHCSKNCNLYEDYDCYVQELPTPSRPPECDEGTWESDAMQKQREAMAEDADHLKRLLRRSMSSLFGRRASPPQKGDRAAFPPDKHCSKNCNLYEDYDCYVQELPTPSRPECDEDTWESDAIQKLREAMAQDAEHLDKLRRSKDDGGLKIGYTNMSLKEVWLSPNFNEMLLKKVARQKSLEQAMD
jgi:hypothetical protein